MERIGGNNAVFRIAYLLFLEFFFYSSSSFWLFEYPFGEADFSLQRDENKWAIILNLILSITGNSSFRFRFGRCSVKWFLRVSSQFEITKRIVSLDFFFFLYIWRCMHLQSFAIGVCFPKGGKKIMIDRCFFILMEANNRYKLIAWWGSNDIMMKREKRDGRVTFKSHDVIENRK